MKLRELIEHGVGAVDDHGKTDPAMREYRALLAVARAADRHERWMTLEERREGVALFSGSDLAIRRTYLRLRRASAPKGKRP